MQHLRGMAQPPSTGAACYTSGMDRPLSLTLYTRPGCHLCDATLIEIERLRDTFPIDLRLVDITRDPGAHDRWWAEIPVVEIGPVVLRAPIDPRRLREALARANGQTS